MVNVITSLNFLTKLKKNSRVFYVLNIIFFFLIYYGISLLLRNLLTKFGKYLLYVKNLNINHALLFSSLLNPIFDAAVAILLVTTALKLYKFSSKDIGWGQPGIENIWKILVGIISVLVYNSVFYSFVFYIEYGQISFSFTLHQPDLSNLMTYYFIFSGLLIAPIIEELFFRGFIQTTLERKLGFKYALIITSLLFAVLHSYKISNWYGCLSYFGGGLLYGLLKKWDGTLWTPVVAHSFFNLTAKWFPMICRL